MKAVITIMLASVTVLYSLHGSAQEAEETADSSGQGSEMYLDEIRSTCEAEAAGLPDADAYIRECIDSMKKSFSGQQD